MASLQTEKLMTNTFIIFYILSIIPNPICLSLASKVSTEMNTVANNEEHRKSSETVQGSKIVIRVKGRTSHSLQELFQ